MYCVIHVDDMAEVFAHVLMADKPAHRVYNSGGTPISLGQIADIVRSFLPDAKITFEHEHGAKGQCDLPPRQQPPTLRVRCIQYPPFPERVLQIINDTRRDVGLPTVG